MPLRLSKLAQGYNDPYFRSLPFDQQMARISLQQINPGPEGVESMSKYRCNTMVVEVEGVDERLSRLGRLKDQVKASPLLALPEKVRHQIFALAVTYDEPIPTRQHTAITSPNATDSKENVIVKRTWRFSPPLLRVCRQTEQEATALFYAMNDFIVELTDGDVTALVAWLQSMNPVHLKLIPKLILSMNVYSYFDLNALRQAEGTVGASYDHQVLSKLLVGGGIRADRIVMVDLTNARNLARDAYWLRRGMKDAEALVKWWFGELRNWLDFEEYNCGAYQDKEEGERRVLEDSGMEFDVGRKMEALMTLA
ncbi:hypothetical protein LTR97_009267 [Elasticomyces elasticus]|uniref:Uncharacterized protein n=1 Tax=Elasticomyces elasticus TaxID=574655 RepID=A0AAN7W286_9PEZI|nr:hypothetical protein LTR97_009267 [Elasticomyces elasticus]